MDNLALKLEPQKSLQEEVEPIKNIKDIMKIKTYLRGKKDLRDYCLFVTGINVGLRAGDLLRLKIGDVYDIENNKTKTDGRFFEEKTKKYRNIELNTSVQDAIGDYISTKDNLDPDEYLFKSRKGTNTPITVGSLHKLIKTTLRELNVKGNYGSHSLRKTFCYWVYTREVGENPGIIQTLQKMLNHSSQTITLLYIGITKEVIKNVYKGLNL